MPAEWEPHRATWISWPHHEPDWPGKLGPIPWVYAEIARVIAEHETVEILCASDDIRAAASEVLDAHAVRPDRVRLHIVPTDRVWLRDSAPTAVVNETGQVVLLNWGFNAWAKYDNWSKDAGVRRGHGGNHVASPRRAAPCRQTGSGRAGPRHPRGRRHRRQRQRAADGDRRVAVDRRAGAQRRPHTTRLRTPVRRMARRPSHDLAR